MYVNWWPHLMGHRYDILSLYICLNISSNIYTGLTPWEYYIVCYEDVIRYSHSDNGVCHS